MQDRKTTMKSRKKTLIDQIINHTNKNSQKTGNDSTHTGACCECGQDVAPRLILVSIILLVIAFFLLRNQSDSK